MRNVWLNPKAVKQEWLKKAIQMKLSDKYKQEWVSEMNNMCSCILYRSFKPELKLEKYQMVLDDRDRINMFKFRCRNLKIPVVV